MKDRDESNNSILKNLMSHISEIVGETTDKSIIQYDDLPQYDLFLSQVTDYLNDKFEHDNFTNSIVQNYIKNEVISKPEDGRKRGYTKLHLVQLVLLGYMRPILSTDEIKSVFKLAFNDINNREDDILSWEDTYKMFGELQQKSLDKYFVDINDGSEEVFKKYLDKYEFKNEEKEKIVSFLVVMSLVAHASNVKRLVNKLVDEFEHKFN
ncbi:MAG: DUF1836 domain-containing protein [Clostridium sp.]|nr:DUF1836 domain-containing protein [Clostridium sp.]